MPGHTIGVKIPLLENTRQVYPPKDYSLQLDSCYLILKCIGKYVVEGY